MTDFLSVTGSAHLQIPSLSHSSFPRHRRVFSTDGHLDHLDLLDVVKSMRARRWTLMKMSASGALTEKRLELPAARDSTGCMRPVTRSQTRSRSSLKRKGPSEDRAETGRPAKLARTGSRSSDASAKCKHEPMFSIPTDVPRSMLSSFRVDLSPFQMYDGERKTTVNAVSRSSSPPRFPATASQPMFDHSWQVADADSSHTGDEEHSLRAPICALPQLTPYPAAVPHHLPPMVIPPPASAPSTRDVAPMMRIVRRLREHGDENRSPAGTALETYRASLSLYCLLTQPTSSGRHMPPEAHGALETMQAGDPVSHAVEDSSCRQKSPSYTHSLSLPATSAHSTMSSNAALPTLYPGSSSVSLHRDGKSEATIVEPAPSCYRPGQTPYANHQNVSLHSRYMHFGAPPPIYPSLIPHLSHLPPNGSHPTDRPSSAPNHAPPYQLYPPIHSAVYPENPSPFATAPMLGSHTPSPHLPGVPLSVSGLDSLHGKSAFVPPFPSPGTATPWCAMFDSLKEGNKRLGGPSKQKKSAIDFLSIPDAHPPAASPSGAAERIRPKGPVAGVHACPLCPRTFTLPNSLAIHLKWHWGASSLDWKRGINLQGKGLQKAFRDAEKRREEIEKLQLELEQALAGEPDPATTASETGEGAAPSSEPDITFDPAYAFDMPVIAQSSLGNIFDFTFDAMVAPVFDDNPENQTPSQTPHACSSSPTLPSSSAAASFSDSSASAYESGPLTPELASAVSGSSTAASVGYDSESPTWSYGLFGGELDTDGVLGVDMNDLFGGGFDVGDIGNGGDGVDISSGGEGGLNVGHTGGGLNFSSSGSDGLDIDGDAADLCRFHLEAEGLNLVSDDCAAFVSSASASLLFRAEVPRAPRLDPLRLPLGLSGGDEDDGQHEHEHQSSLWQCGGGGGDDDDIGPAFLQSASMTVLAPLDDFGSLQSLPGLDAFDRLSLF
ncbi:hypothetical protein C8T65DRAFT_741271 [Cerioporus squamosus]|nr:hypothetical protein C8T65DRAFT_741271 [Cerioporus squamosus]